MAYIKQKDLAAALSPTTYLALFDDEGNGQVPDPSIAVQQIITRAHAEVMSYLARIYRVMPNELPSGVPDLLFAAELDYACAFAFERHPEAVRSYGDDKRASLWKRADARMERIADGIQQIPPNDPNAPPVPGQGVLRGGLIQSDGQRMVIMSADGTPNGGDFSP